MTDRSEMYISLRGEVQGKRRLDAQVVNPLLREYRRLLEKFKIEERKDDGGQFKAWADHVDEFNFELLSDKIALFSHKLKLNIFDTFPHSFNNYQHHINAEIAKGLGKIRVDNHKAYSQKITILTTGIKFAGGERTTGKWPQEKMLGIGM